MTLAERIDRLPATRTGRWTTLGMVAGGWLAAYWVNGRIWDILFYDVLDMDPDARLTQSLHFFFFDSVKIAPLLTGIIFVVTVLRSYMSIERTRALLGGRREGLGNVMAAGLGVVTPFCSCSAVPSFIGFVAAGVPLGVTLSFLIASPLVKEIAIGMLFSLFSVLFGWKVTLAYIAAGVGLAIVGGWILGRLRLERWVEPFVFETKLGGQVIDSTAGLTFNQRPQMGAEEVGTILRKIWPYLLGWVSSSQGQTTDANLAQHRNDADIAGLEAYFTAVIDWVVGVFIRPPDPEMKGLAWGKLYETYHSTSYNTADLDKRVDELRADDAVRNARGIYEYLLGGETATQLLDIRLFDDQTKRVAYSPN